MAAGDQLVIRATPAGPLNAGYTTSASQSIEVTSAVATFNGTGAGSSFVPAVGFYSADGTLLTRAVASTTIAAGSSAEVSFFPFVQAASSGTPSGPAVAYGSLEILDNAFANTGFNQHSVDMSSSGLVTTDTSVFDTVTVGGIGGMQLKAPGQYLVTASVLGDAFAAPAAGSFVQTSTSSTLEASVTEMKIGGWFAIDAFGDYRAAAAHQIIASVGEIGSPVPRNVFLRAGQNSGLTVQIHAVLTAILLTSDLLA